MARIGLIGVAAGLAAVVGGSVWAMRRLFGSDDGSYSEPAGGEAGAEESAGAAPRREGLDPTLLEILACPDCKQPVIYQQEGDAERLTCTNCGKRYPVRDGIPVMLIDEAEPGPPPTAAEIAAAKELAPLGKPAIVGAAPRGATAASDAAASGAGGVPPSAREASSDTVAAPESAGGTGG